MNIFTSYYANIKNIPSDYVLVSISGSLPEYYEDKVHHIDKRLAPNWSLFKEYKESEEGPAREKQYIKRFKNEVLVDNDINEILKDWGDIFGLNKNYVILCYEKPEDFCHRQIVAETLEQKFGNKVSEIGIDPNNFERIDYKYQSKGIDEDEW